MVHKSGWQDSRTLEWDCACRLGWGPPCPRAVTGRSVVYGLSYWDWLPLQPWPIVPFTVSGQSITNVPILLVLPMQPSAPLQSRVWTRGLLCLAIALGLHMMISPASTLPFFRWAYVPPQSPFEQPSGDQSCQLTDLSPFIPAGFMHIKGRDHKSPSARGHRHPCSDGRNFGGGTKDTRVCCRREEGEGSEEEQPQ